MEEDNGKPMVDFVKKYLSDHDSNVFFVEHNKATFSNHLAQVSM